MPVSRVPILMVPAPRTTAQWYPPARYDRRPEGFRGSLRSAYMSGPYAPRSLNRAFCRNKTGSEYRTNGFLKQAMRFLEFRRKSFSTPMQVLEGIGAMA